MENYNELKHILFENIENIKNLDIKSKYARDEIMKGNCVTATAKAIIQLEIVNLAKEKNIEKKELLNGKNYVLEQRKK